MEYIQTFGSYSQPAEPDFFNNSNMPYAFRATHQKQMYVSYSMSSDDFLGGSLGPLTTGFTLPASFELGSPPALPPKKNRVRWAF